jgi:hypothetical protein
MKGFSKTLFVVVDGEKEKKMSKTFFRWWRELKLLTHLAS